MVTSVHLLKAALAGEVGRGCLTHQHHLSPGYATDGIAAQRPFLPYYLKLQMLVIWVQNPPPIITYLIFSSVILFCGYECACRQQMV